MRAILGISAAALGLLAATPAVAAEIFRCSTPGGSISYQQFPCAPGSEAGRIDIPTAYPDIDAAARDRLLQREAALDRRLEAERERLSREEMTRITARAQVAAAQAVAPAPEPVYSVGWPVVLARRPFPTHRMHRPTLLR